MKYDKKIFQLATNIVNKMFISFKEEKFQGPSFTWEDFPTMMKSLAQAHTPATFFRVSGKELEEIEQKVGEITLKLAQEKVDREIFKKPSIKTM